MSTSLYIFSIQNKIFFNFLKKDDHFFDHLHSFVYDKIAILILIHRTMKKIVQNVHIKYNTHHKHQFIQSCIVLIVYEIKNSCLSFASSLANNLSIHFLNFSFFASSSLFCWSTTECLCRNSSYLFFNLLWS